MQVVSFLGFSIIYMYIYLANAESEYRVKVMNDMFTHPGWLDWNKNEYICIIDRWMNTNEIFDVHDLLGSTLNGRIVTNENAQNKIRQAHQFLSCKFTIVLKKIFEYEKGIATACRIMDNQSTFLNNLKQLWEITDSLHMRMLGALSYFQQFSPETPFNNDVLEILGDLKNYYINIHSISIEVTAYAEEKMSLTIKRLSTFYNSVCWPIPYGERDVFQAIIKANKPKMVVYELKSYINKTVEQFVKSFDNLFGFKFDLLTKMTCLMYDPDLLKRVKLMNKLLACPGWLALDNLEIIVEWNRYDTVNDLLTVSTNGKIVTKVNVDEKFQQGHHFLTCKYAITLGRCCDYVSLIWKQYNSSMNLSDPTTHWEKFVNIITKSEPLVSLMQDALSHFYQLSPHVEYNRDVYCVLESFKNYLNTEFFTKKNYNEVINGNVNIETDMTNVVERLTEFFEDNCFPNYLFLETTFDKNAEVELSSLEEDFIQEIDILKSSNYTDFGFLLDTIENTTSKRKNLCNAEESPL